MNKKTSSGFTIMETMIVLAITGVMFISVVLLINGKQQQAQFQTSVKDVQAQVRQVMTETSAGFNQLGNNTCGISGGKPALSPGTSDTIGTNANCVFLGKTLIFSQDKESFIVAPVVGLRQPVATEFDGQFVPDLNRSKPIISTTLSAATKKLQFGLAPVAMYLNDDVTQKVGSVSFVSTPGIKDTNLAAGSQTTMSQNLNLVAITQGSSLSNSLTTEKGAIENALQNGTVVNNKYINSTDDKVKVSICFKSGTTGQSYLLSIGSGGNGIGFESKIFNDGKCGAA